MMSGPRWIRRARCLLPPTLFFLVVLGFLTSSRNFLLSDRLPETWHLSGGSTNGTPPLPRTFLHQPSELVTIRDYIVAAATYSGNSSVTLTTQGTYEFLHHVEQLCIRWRAPVSVAVYAPGRDFFPAVDRILFLRQCRHPCLKANVTWHFIFDKFHAPAEEALLLAPERSVSCLEIPNSTSNYRWAHSLTYPINVARNVARRAARTHYVLASDIELYPSLDLVPKFLDLVGKESGSWPRVYVLPIFEVKEDCRVPDTKRQLLELFSQRKAVFFHRSVCDVCHRFPNRNLWLKMVPPDDSLNVFAITKRSYPWEPFYIGTHREPAFDERFTWEGKMNKMPQALEMCFMDYDFCILDNAFLVHSPGIKKINLTSERLRAKFTSANRRAYYAHRQHLTEKYGKKPKCR